MNRNLVQSRISGDSNLERIHKLVYKLSCKGNQITSIMTEIDIQQVADSNAGPFHFKNPNYKHPVRRVKATKQLMIDEQKYLKANEEKLKKDSVNYFSIDSPPSVKPTKKYCDITGLKGNYKSPSSGLRYYNGEIYSIVKNMAPGVDQQYLELRNANVVLK